MTAGSPEAVQQVVGVPLSLWFTVHEIL